MIYIECNNFSKNRLCKHSAFAHCWRHFSNHFDTRKCFILLSSNNDDYDDEEEDTMMMMTTATATMSTTTEISFAIFGKLQACFYGTIISLPVESDANLRFHKFISPPCFWEREREKWIWLPLFVCICVERERESKRMNGSRSTPSQK